MTQYILNYIPGAKGDFLCNFINFKSIQIENKCNKSKTNYKFFKNLYTRDFNEIDTVEFLRKNTEIRIFPAHYADKIPKDFLLKYDIKLIHLVADKEYLQTISLDALFKNITDMPMDDTNRLLLINNTVRNLKNTNHQKALLLRIRKHLLDDIVLDYKNLYIDKNFKQLIDLFDINVKSLSQSIDNTWLPNEIDMFGQKWYPADYGYRNFKLD